MAFLSYLTDHHGHRCPSVLALCNLEPVFDCCWRLSYRGSLLLARSQTTFQPPHHHLRLFLSFMSDLHLYVIPHVFCAFILTITQRGAAGRVLSDFAIAQEVTSDLPRSALPVLARLSRSCSLPALRKLWRVLPTILPLLLLLPTFRFMDGTWVSRFVLGPRLTFGLTLFSNL